MLLALDVYYMSLEAKAVGVLFERDASSSTRVVIEYIKNVEPYQPGSFYLRELPCILEVIAQVNLKEIEAIIVDGHVYVDNEGKPGLGGHLWNALNKEVPVIGLAKNVFLGTERVSKEVYRGNSKRPLYLSWIGLQEDQAMEIIHSLHGEYRMPTMLKELDQITKDK